METSDNKPEVKKPKKKRLVLKIIIVVVVLLIAILIAGPLLLPSYLSSKSGNKFILEQANKRLEGNLNFESLSMSWGKGIEISGLTFKDKEGNISADIKNIQAQPHYLSLLSQQANMGTTVLDQPIIELTIPKPSEKQSQDKQPVSVKIMLPLINLAIYNGDIKVKDQSGKTIELSEVNTKINLRPAGEQSDFDINANVSSDDIKTKFVARGQLTQKKDAGWSLEGTSGNLTVDFNNMDIESLGVFFAMAGVDVKAKGNVSANLSAEMKDGQMEKVDGYIKGQNLDFTGPFLKGDSLHTKNLDINTRLSRKQDMINIENFIISTDWLKAQAKGTAPANVQMESFDKFLNSGAELAGNFEVQVATVLSQLPNMVGIKKGMQINSGLLKGNIQTATDAGKKVIVGQASLAGLAGKLDGKNVALSQPITITAQIGAEGKVIRLDKLDVASSFAQLNCSGTEKEIKYTFDADLSKLQSEAGQFVDFGAYKFGGNFSAEQGTVTFNPERITMAGTTQIKELMLSSGKTIAVEPQADIKFQMEYRTKEQVLAITSLNTSASMGRVNITDSTVALNKESNKQTQINLSAQAVDLAKVQPFAILFASLPEEMKFAGIAQSDLLLTQQNNDLAIKTNNTKINNLKISYPGQKDFAQEEMTLVADCKLNLKDKTYTINGSLISPQIKIKGQFENTIKGDTGNLKGQADLDYDWASLSTLAAPFLPQGLKIEGKRKDVILLSSQYPAAKPEQMFANLNAKAGLGFDRVQYEGLDAGTTQVNIAADKGQMKIAPFSTTLNKGTLNFAANVDLKSTPARLTMPAPVQFVKDFQLNDIIANNVGIYLNPIFLKAVNVTGRASFYCDTMIVPLSSKNLNDMDISGTVSIDNLVMQSDLLGSILTLIGLPPNQQIIISPVKFVLKDGKLKYDKMQITIGRFTLAFLNATIGLDKSYDLILDLPISGKRVQIPLKAKAGEMPKIDVQQFLKIQGINLLEQQLQKLLEKK